jgi:hypothetical protein
MHGLEPSAQLSTYTAGSRQLHAKKEDMDILSAGFCTSSPLLHYYNNLFGRKSIIG